MIAQAVSDSSEEEEEDNDGAAVASGAAAAEPIVSDVVGSKSEQSDYILLAKVHGDKDPIKVPVNIHMDCPMTLKRRIMEMSGDLLNYADFEITKDGTHVIGDEMVSLDTLKVKSGDKLTLKVNALAGGKRGRADKSKASRMSDLREEAGTTQLRINAHPNMAPTITGILHICLQLSGVMQETPNEIVSWMFARTPGDKLREMLTVCSGTNSLENRFALLADNFFSAQKEALEELDKQIKLCKGLTNTYITMTMVSQFGDEAGNVQWAAFTKGISGVLENRAAQAGAAEALRGLGG
jgi:hypothetical protein